MLCCNKKRVADITNKFLNFSLHHFGRSAACLQPVPKSGIRRCTTQATKFIKYRQQKKETDIKWILLAVPITTFGLGCWQVKRLGWKLNLIQNLQQNSNSQPVDLPRDFSELNTMEYMPVRVKGEFLHDKELLIGPRSLIEPEPAGGRPGSLITDPNKNQGYIVVTPFRLHTGETILVNRGWVPQQMKSKKERQASLIEDEVELVGLVRLTEKRPPFMPKNKPEKGQWYYRDLEEMSEYAGCSPVWLDAKGRPDPPAGWPIPNQTRVTLRNEHLSYIVTWFSLSAFTAYMWHRLCIKKLPLL